LKNILLLCCMFLAAPNAYGAAPGYHVVKRLELGGEGSWDYLTVDDTARRLYVSRSSHVMVVDLDTDKLVGDIPETPGVHGIAIAPELKRGFTSNGKGNTVTIFDLKTLQAIGQVQTGSNPDAIVYDPASKTVFTFNGRSHDITVIAADSGKVVKTIPLGGKPEYATADGKGKLFVNIEDTGEVAEIDSLNARVSRRYSLQGCEEPTGMAIDRERGRLFSGCHNKVMTVLDIKTGKVIASIPIGARVDGNGFDAGTGFAFSSNGDGTLTVAGEASPGRFAVLETVATQSGSRTMALDPQTHKVYLPAARFTPLPPHAAGRQQPEMLKNSFELIVVGK
jgi:DNA-binding beta-propeller fold protein YncE